jgi:TM2 domain-containing membrane protein YozV
MKGTLIIPVLFAVIVVGVGADALAAQPSPACRVKGDPLLIGAASFLIPGLGQFLNGEDGKGLTHLLVGLALPVGVTIAAVLLGAASPIIGTVLYLAAPLIYLAWAVHSAVDAYHTAAQYCQL